LKTQPISHFYVSSVFYCLGDSHRSMLTFRQNNPHTGGSVGYQLGRAFAKFTGAMSFVVLIISLPLAVLSGQSNKAVMDAHALNQAKSRLQWIDDRTSGKTSSEWVERPAPDLTPPATFFFSFLGAAFVCSLCFSMIAIFDIADRLREKPRAATIEQPPPPSIANPAARIIEMEPTPPRGHVGIEEAPEPPSEEDRDARVARRIAEYEARKKK
jgi:hypothetical protein